MSVLPILKLGSTDQYVKLLQMDLNGLALNYNGFALDGVFNTKTRDAIKNFQDRFELPSDGVVDSVTWKVLLENVKAVQKLLNSRGYPTGYPDGWLGPVTTIAIQKFQNDNGLYPTGIVDPRTRERLFNPHPKDNFENRITTAFRSWAEEDKLFAQGRWTPGNVVTNARGGDSYHNWGLAFDAAPFENGVISNDTEKFIRMGHLGQLVGLQWGGTFKSIVDYPHFQYTFGLNTWDLLNGVRSPA